MHIELWEENRNKLLSVSGTFDKSSNRFVNQLLISMTEEELFERMLKIIKEENQKKGFNNKPGSKNLSHLDNT